MIDVIFYILISMDSRFKSLYLVYLKDYYPKESEGCGAWWHVAGLGVGTLLSIENRHYEKAHGC